MKGDAQAIRYLNQALYQRLTAINQYFLHARMLKNWGLEAIGKHAYKASIDAMKQADALSERILFLEGLPNFQALGKLRIGEAPVETLDCDLALETEGLAVLREAIAHCESVEDYVSRKLLAGVLESGEEHVDWLETQLDLVARIGVENYLQSQLDED